MVGKTLGQYQIVKELGKGGFATVYKAYQPALKRHVALKILHPQYVSDSRALRRFRHEAMGSANLRHPNIITIFDFGEEAGLAYIVMEYIRGGTLKSRLGALLDEAMVLKVVRSVGSALDYAHEKGTVHRDVKPANVLFTEDDQVILSDFGIAKMAESSVSLTKGILGTPQYMSPEQSTGAELNGRSDLYSLGIMLYEMLTGHVPFRADTPLTILSMHVNAPVPPLRSANPSVPAPVEAVVSKTLAKSPKDRYRKASEIVTALEVAWARPAEAAAPERLAAAAPPAASVWTAAPPALEMVKSKAAAALSRGRWLEAVDLLEGAAKMDPGDAELRRQLSLARREHALAREAMRKQERLADLYSSATARMAPGSWQWAVGYLQELVGLDPGYRDASELLKRAQAELQREQEEQRRTQRLLQLRQQAEPARASGRWKEAAALLQEVVLADPEDQTSARHLEEATRMARIEELNVQAAALAKQGRWRDAISVLEEAKALDQHYRDLTEPPAGAVPA